MSQRHTTREKSAVFVRLRYISVGDGKHVVHDKVVTEQTPRQGGGRIYLLSPDTIALLCLLCLKSTGRIIVRVVYVLVYAF